MKDKIPKILIIIGFVLLAFQIFLLFSDSWSIKGGYSLKMIPLGLLALLIGFTNLKARK